MRELELIIKRQERHFDDPRYVWGYDIEMKMTSFVMVEFVWYDDDDNDGSMMYSYDTLASWNR